jgi:hypothetical protein
VKFHPAYETSTEIDKYTKKICAPSWFYLQDYTEMHGQQNIKNKVWPFHTQGKIRLRAQLPVTVTIPYVHTAYLRVSYNFFKAAITSLNSTNRLSF